MNVKQMLLSCNKDVTAMILFHLQGGLQVKVWDHFQEMYDAFYEKVAATEALAGDFVILGSSYRSGTEEIYNVYAYTRASLLFDFRRCQAWEQDWAEEELVARLDLLKDSMMYYSTPYHCVMSSMSWEVLLGAEVFEKNLRAFGHDWMAAIVIYKMIFTEHVQGNPTEDTSILGWIAEYRELLCYVAHSGSEACQMLLVCAGVEGAGKTSVCGVFQESYANIMETALVPTEMEQIRKARQEGFYIRLVYLGLNTLEEHLQRIQNRAAKGGAAADPVEVERQFQHRFAALTEVLSLCHEAAFYDCTNGFCRVAEYRYSQLNVTQVGRGCTWLNEWLDKDPPEKTVTVWSDLPSYERIKIIQVIPNDDFSLTLGFSNGEYRRLDMKPHLKPGTVNEKIMRIEDFRRVYLDENHAVCWDIDPNVDSKLVWNNVIDLCPNWCYIMSVPCAAP